MPALPILALSALLGLAPLQLAAAAPTATDQVEVEAALLRVIDARMRWHRALDAAGWDRDAPAAQAAADALTAELLPQLGRDDEVGAAATALLEDLGGEPLGAYLRGQAAPEPRLVVAYTRRHPDPALVQLLEPAPGGDGALHWLELAAAHRAAAAGPLAAIVAAGRGLEREASCAAALALPSAARAQVATALAATLPAERPEDPRPACTVLAAQTRSGRARLAAWLAAAPHPPPSRPFAMVAVAALAGTDQNAAAARAAAVTLGPPNDAAGQAWQLREGADWLARHAPQLRLEAPATRWLLASTGDRIPETWAALAPARLFARDPRLAAEALAALRDPNAPAEQLAVAVGVAGLAAGRGPRGAAPLREGLESLREQGRTFAGLAPSLLPWIDAWVDAVERVAACRGARRCLADLVAQGSDAAAARAAFALDGRGLAALERDAARALLSRLAVGPDPFLLAAVVLSPAAGSTRRPTCLDPLGEVWEPVETPAGTSVRPSRSTATRSSWRQPRARCTGPR